MVDAELQVTFVDVGTQRVDAHRLAFVHEFRYRRDVGQASAHHARHVLRGVIGFEVSRLVSNPGVAGSVALVESVRGEGAPVIPNLFKHLGVVAIGRAALDELGIHVVQLLNKFLTHGLSQGIAFASGKVGYLARQQHDLLLIHRNAISVFQVFLHARQVVGNGLFAVFARNELRDVLHGAGAVEGVHGDEVLKGGGLQFAQILLHARRLKLERAHGVAVAIKLVGGRVVDVDGIDVEVNAKRKFDVLHRFLNNRKRLEAEEVHLDQARFLNHLALVLRAVQFLARFLVACRRYGHPV